MISITLGLVLVMVGLVSMLLSTISGGGSNVILVPVLILAFAASPGSAIGTSFFAVTFGNLAAISMFSSNGKVDYKWGLILGGVGLPGVIVGSLATSLVQEVLFKFLLGIVVVTIASLMLIRSSRARPPNGNGGHQNSKEGYTVRSKYVPLFFATGIFVGMFGAGGGLVLMPLTLFIGLPVVIALGTMRVVGLIMGAAALLTRLGLAQVDLELGFVLALGAIFGGILGVRISLGVEARKLRQIVALLILFLGIALLLESSM